VRAIKSIVCVAALSVLTAPGSAAAPDPAPGVSHGVGTSFLAGTDHPKGSAVSRQAPKGPQEAYQEAVDRAVADAVNSFLGQYLSPRAFAEAESYVAKRIKENPDQFVPQVKVVSLGQDGTVARAEVEARISLAALRGVLLEVVPARSILFAVKGERGGREFPENTVATRLIANLRRLKSDFKVIDPGELETLFRTRPELRNALGGEAGSSELGLRVLAELVCVGTIRIGSEETHLDGVYIGNAEADLRVIDCKTAEVVGAVSVTFRDSIGARREEALRRAERTIFKKAAQALVREVPKKKGAGLRISCDLGPIYTALLNGYRVRPFGVIRVVNRGKERVGPLNVRLVFDENLLLEPFVVRIPALSPGAEREIPVRGSLTSKLALLGDQEIAARVAVEAGGGSPLEELRRAVVVHDPNVFSWREPEAIAAYVDAEDPALKDLLSGVWRALPSQGFPTPGLTRAAGIYAALSACGLKYKKDASVPALSLVSRTVNDRVSYPGQMLEEGAGDCDDFAVLLAAAFEAGGLRSAVLVGKDHVLAAVESGFEPVDLASELLGSEGLLVHEGAVWLPIETTAIAQGDTFLDAWRSAWPAAREIGHGGWKFVDVRKAWRTWRPIPRPRKSGVLRLGGFGTRIRREVEALRSFGLERLRRRAQELRNEDARNADRLLGNLYAACGMIEEARKAYARALGGDDPFAVHFNLGEVLLLGARTPRNIAASIAEFRAALEALPQGDLPARADTLVRLALAYRFSGNPEAEKKALEEAFAINPDLKKEYAALTESPTKGALLSDRIRRFLLTSLRR